MLSKTEAGSWEESSRACGSQGANLTSLHSLSEVEMLLKLLANCKQHRAVQIYEVLFVIETPGVYYWDTKYCIACVNAVVCAVSGESTEVWIGLWKQASLPTVEWSDGSPVTLTLWHQYHPPHNLTDAALCAKADRKVGNSVLVLLSCKTTLQASRAL